MRWFFDAGFPDNKMKTAALKDTLCFREGSMQVYCSALTAATWVIFSFGVKWQNWGSQLWGVPPDVQSRWQSPASWVKTAACGSQEGPQTQKVVTQRPEHLRSASSNQGMAPDRVLLPSNITGGERIFITYGDFWGGKSHKNTGKLLINVFPTLIRVIIQVFHKEGNIIVGVQHLQLSNMDLLWVSALLNRWLQPYYSWKMTKVFQIIYRKEKRVLASPSHQN